MNNYEQMMQEEEKKKAKANANNFVKMDGIYHKFEDGNNFIRLVGPYLKLQTHFLAGNGNMEGVCTKGSIASKEVPAAINCPNWDIEEGRWLPRSEGTCPLCAMRQKLWEEYKEKEEGLDEQEAKKFKDAMNKLKATESIKWNIIDRNNPNITIIEGESKKNVLGFKICNMGKTIYEGIHEFFLKRKADLADADNGIDFEIKKKTENKKVSYTVGPAMNEDFTVKATPLTQEERELTLLDLKKICGKMPELDKIVENLVPQYKKVYDSVVDTLPKQEKQEEKQAEDVQDDCEENEETPACFGNFDHVNEQPECSDCEFYNSCQKSSN